MQDTRKTLALCALVVLALATTSCSAQEGAPTLDALVEQCKAADDLATLMPLVHPEDRAMLGFLMLQAGEGEGEQFEAINQRYDLKEPSGDAPEDLRSLAGYWFDGVDVIAYATEVEQALLDTHGPDAMEGFLPDFSQLEDLQAGEDRATGTIRGQEFAFERHDDGWFLRIDM